MKDCYLKKNSEFQRVYSNKKISGSRYITLFTVENNRDYPRFGITVTKKVGNAVNRNFVRRRLKHLLRENSHKIKSGYDYVFVAKKDASESDFKNFKNSFFSVLKRQKKMIKWVKYVCY